MHFSNVRRSVNTTQNCGGHVPDMCTAFSLGITLNWGVLIAWSALRGAIEWPVLPLYAACSLWTMTYDTIYSHQVCKSCMHNNEQNGSVS